MLLENECERLKHWFEETYPEGRITIHQGISTKDRHEEYNIEFHYNNRHFGAELRVPPGGEDQDREFIEMFRQKFLDTQKAKIAKAITKVRYV